MFVGHAAVALAAKVTAPRASLGTFIAATYALDLVWPFLLLLGIEHVRIDPGNTAFTPLAFESYPWSHSLLMAFAWGLAGTAAGPDDERGAGDAAPRRARRRQPLAPRFRHTPSRPPADAGIIQRSSDSGSGIRSRDVCGRRRALRGGDRRLRPRHDCARSTRSIMFWLFVAFLTLIWASQPCLRRRRASGRLRGSASPAGCFHCGPGGSIVTAGRGRRGESMSMIKGLATAIYQVPDLTQAKAFYTAAFQQSPSTSTSRSTLATTSAATSWASIPT